MGITRKFAALALAFVMTQSLAVTSLAVNDVDTVASSAISASTVKTYSLKLNFGQSKMAYDVASIPCHASYSCSGNCVGVTDRGEIIAYRSGGSTVVAKGDNGITYKIYVTVSGNPTSVTLSKSSVTNGVGRSFTLTATVPNFSSKYNFSKIATWSSSDTSVATVTQQGVVSCLKKGTANITVTTYNGKTAVCKVNVKPAPTSVKLDKTSVSLAKGYTYALAKIYTPSDAYTAATWKSSNTAVATVSSKGIVTAKATGTATITVTTYNGKTATCKVTVKPDPTAVKLNTISLDLKVGETYTLVKTLTPSNAYPKVTWSSNNTNIATVSASGVVTAKGTGTTVITVTTYNGKTATCKVTVDPNYIDEVIRLVNVERAKENLPALKKDTSLCNFANTRAKETFVLFSHNRPDGRAWYTIFQENNYSYSAGGENIAAGQATPEAVVRSWMNSAGHRANIMSANYTKIGVGHSYAADSTYKHYWTQLFAK